MVSLFNTKPIRMVLAALMLAAAPVSLAIGTGGARAADPPIFAPGEPIVTGFSGVVAPDSPPAGSDPLDYTFIDPDGPSLVIQHLQPDGPGAGQLIDAPNVFAASAKDVGQVFGVALDDAPETSGALAPNIYVAASSAFGLNIVVPDADGNPVRSRTGAPDARFMAGQWGNAGGAEGYPGSIWKIDGTTGEISLFTTIAANSGAGLGNIVFDAASQQFFVSDLDSGLIYRLGADGTILDSFDHGLTARPTHGLAAVADDGSSIDITDPAFAPEDPRTWGLTQAERAVYGLAVRGGRLYYSAAASADDESPSIWSVRINADGSFGTARWELDVAGLASTNPITSIVFDAQGRMILAQRGPQVNFYDYSAFAAPGDSSVVRYRREFPDDPTTPSNWVETPDSYAIGVAAGGTNASGGVALGYGFSTASGAFSGACNATVWASGDALRANPDLVPPLDGPAFVDGLQGMSKASVRPLNDPPLNAFFTDYDGKTADEPSDEPGDLSPQQAGHVGAVAIWQVCDGPSAPLPDVEEPDEPDFIPPPDYVLPEHYNLTLEKWAKPHFCFDGGANYWCSYTIRVENTGTVPYWGPVSVHDYLPANPPGASMSFWPQPPWACGPTGPAAYNCVTGPVLLYPGDGVVLHEVVKLPKPVAAGVCQLVNVAGIQWPFWGHDDDPSDDFDGGVAGIPAPGCVPVGPGISNLTLTKIAFPANCIDAGIDYLCNYRVLVQNAGPGNYSGPITVKDTLGTNAPANVFGPWTCPQVGPVLTCTINTAPVSVPPGWTSGFIVRAHMKKPAAPPLCDLPNKANIVSPAGGTPSNILPGDDFDSATTHLLSPACLAPHPHTDLKITKSGLGCFAVVGGYACKWSLTITNVGPDGYVGPLTLKDTSAGAIASTLPSAVPWCAGVAVVNCAHAAPVALASGVPHSVSFFTKYAGGPTVCSATNNVAIVAPNPGSVQNPGGNDSATVGQAIPNPACAGLPALNITKTATGCASDPHSTDWLCTFDVKVKNIGPVAQPAPIVVRDINSKPTTFNTPACAPFAVNQWQCTRAVPLGPGATWSFVATTHVDPNGVTLADCNVVNTVGITTPFSSDPGHVSQANQKVPQLYINPGPGPLYVYCDPPSLKLSKTAGKTVKAGDGYDSTFTIKAISTGPDPYHGTVEIDEVLPAGTSYVSSSWTCVPTSGNDVHCSSPYVDMPVGQSTSMNITIHIPRDAAVRNKCEVINTASVAISAEVLHSDIGAKYTASAKATLPADACAKPPVCPPRQVKPGGGCCDSGLLWNGKQCTPPKPIPPPPPKCPRDSVAGDNGACLCKSGTHGKPGKCVPDQVVPVCKRDSVLVDGQCECKPGTHGEPGRCKPDQQAPICARDSVVIDGQCVCRPGSSGKPGRCVPDEQTPPPPPVCKRDSVLVDGACACREGTHGVPGRCVPDVVIPVPPVVKPPVITKPPVIERPPVILRPAPSACPDDSHFDKRQNGCVCNPPLVGKPGSCAPQLLLQLPVVK